MTVALIILKILGVWLAFAFVGVQTFEAKYARELVGRTLRSWAATFADAWEKRAA